MCLKLCFIILGVLKPYACFDIGDQPVVTLNDGQIQGEVRESRSGSSFAAFEGLPYAKPPTGELRFEPPVPPDPWSGLRISEPHPPCMQFPINAKYTYDNIMGEEDCLYLNVYTPSLDENANLSVIVLLDGGIFMAGPKFATNPSLIMDLQEFIYVTLYYRLGILGFLSTEDDVVPGNMGLKDQNLALKWVQKNIKLFGGNPESVTLAGNSAGAISVQYHMYSAMSDGLFHRAMSVSGSALSSWALTTHGLEKAKKLATNIGCETENVKDMIICLKKPDGALLVGQTVDFLKFLYTPLIPFGPVVEKEGPNAFITKPARESILQGDLKDVPFLITFVDRQGNYPATEMIRNDSTFKELNKNWDENAISVLGIEYSVPKEKQKEITDAVKQFYYKGRPISRDTFFNVVEMYSDRLFSVGIEETIRLHKQAEKGPVYCYKFNYRGLKSVSEFFSGTTENFGATHTDDMLYMYSPPPVIADEGNGIVELMLGIVSSFARTGHPAAGDINWVPACCTAAEDITFLNINDGEDFTMKQDNSISNLDFWKKLEINDF